MNEDSQDRLRGERIAKLIRRSGMSKSRVALECDVSPSQITRIIGGSSFSIDMLKKLATTLNATTDYILLGHEPMADFSALGLREQNAVMALIENLLHDPE